ncbi:GNAT family N-acetyltransferase [Helcobacillus massiliensis]|uniref:GNAT family N-acetyltransferase n=1 Tax=Helcobacillus massiliensis TaxID=521392 RepID=UPI002557556C|nr:GNAT family N-acetyltransferase [Helcobacillus massiliensis]MDK7742321.1 GNAT family N-acetyltransferase [Helcobacillus massiliensis]WOO92043.1 GNAT family N-acetyltransferase [Helcobacillus massiliensis]
MKTEGTNVWPVRLTTDRLSIREPSERDRPALIELITADRARDYLGGAVGFASRQALELSPLGLTWGRWVIAATSADGVEDHTDDAPADRMLGIVTLSYDREELELTYALLPNCVGFGYAAEACRAVLDWAAENLPDEHVIAVTASRNKRSVALLKRLGFTTRKGLTEFGEQCLLMERPLALD